MTYHSFSVLEKRARNMNDDGDKGYILDDNARLASKRDVNGFKNILRKCFVQYF